MGEALCGIIHRSGGRRAAALLAVRSPPRRAADAALVDHLLALQGGEPELGDTGYYSTECEDELSEVIAHLVLRDGTLQKVSQLAREPHRFVILPPDKVAELAEYPAMLAGWVGWYLIESTNGEELSPVDQWALDALLKAI